MLVMDLSWMQDVAILERHSGNEERICYIRTVLRFGWKKTRLLDAIESQVWLYSSPNEQVLSCYAEKRNVSGA
jgi:hypothetical protein